MQFADSVGNIAAGALIHTYTFSSCIFRIFLLFSERGQELFHVTQCKHWCYIIWKVYLLLFASGLKGIRFPFAMCKRVLDTACNRIACGNQIPFCALAKGCLIAFWAIAKGYQIHFRANGMRNPRIACNADNVSNIPLSELNSKFKK